jgi:hypothetical protein
MKQGAHRLLCLSLLLLMFAVPAMADDVTLNLESRILETFDTDTRSTEWFVRASKFSRDGEAATMVYAPAWPEALFGTNTDGADLRVLGVNAGFDKLGYNWLEFIPVQEDDEGNYVENPLEIPGRAQRIDFWVWGSNYLYTMEVHLRDYNGRMHVLPVGHIQYTGWRNLYTEIPGYIPQAGGYITSGGFNKNLELVKIVMWTTPEEKVDDFYVYLDHIKVLTDVFVTRFDGDDLADPANIDSIWSNAQGGN